MKLEGIMAKKDKKKKTVKNVSGVQGSLLCGWIGVDLDGTLAHYDGWHGETHIGPPVPAMLEKVKDWINQGKLVKIFTARACNPESVAIIQAWCEEHIGVILEVTATKDFGMIELWDDRCVQVIPNEGISLQEHIDALHAADCI
jgi:hypothetical protein